MCRAPAILAAILVVVPAAPAQSVRDWNNVQKLKLEDPILIRLRSGEKVRGEFVEVLDDRLQIAAFVPFQYDVRNLREINRADIRKIELVRRDQHLPNPRTWAIRGAIVGGAAGVGLGIHRDISEPTACGHACWFVDGVGGAGGGYMVGLISCATVGIAHLFRHNRLIYEAKTAPAPLQR